jgi:hypothetical protein
MCEASSEAAIKYLSSLFLLLLSSRPLLPHPLSTSIDNSSIHSLSITHQLTSSLLLLLLHLLHLYLSSEAFSIPWLRLTLSISQRVPLHLAQWAAEVVVRNLIVTLVVRAIKTRGSMSISRSLRKRGYFGGVSDSFPSCLP